MAKRQPTFQRMADLGAAAIDASITLWWRWPIILSAGSASKDSAELNRMVSEKTGVAAAGLIAAQTKMMRITARALTGKRTSHPTSIVAAAALKPAFRAVKANAKRLRKKRQKP
jgi:hypothetical protein